MAHRLRFLPLILILAGVAIGLALQPPDSSAQTSVQATAGHDALAGGARTARRADAALRIARRARMIARRALKQANAILAIAEGAQSDAQAAQSAAAQSTARLDAAAVVSATAPGAVSTAEDAEYVDLGGPSVTVDVPASGLVEIWASVRFDDPSDGQVALFEDDQIVPIPGQELTCSPGGTIGDVLLSYSGGAGIAQTLSTPTAPDFGIGCGVIGGVPGPMLFDRAPGRHTYELRYADCGCEPGDASFSQRLLRAAGRE